MTKVRLSDIFKGNFLSYITAYKKRIQTILSDYDVAIFMARKAICFFDSLRYNNEIFEDKCRVISSRVLDYNTLDDLKGKKIAVIDDVVVRGKSLTRVASILYEAGIKADYYVVACEEKFSKEFNNNEIILEENYNIFSSGDIYQLSGAITKYIEASMRTFNVDSPIFDLSDCINDVKRVLKDFGAINLTNGLQAKYGIESENIYFKFDSRNKDDYITQVLGDSIFKIRFYYNDERVVAVPFVLMPACNISVIQSIYNVIKNSNTDNLIKCENNRLLEENRLKLISYLFSSILFIEFANRFGFKYKKDIQNEIIQFNYVIDEIISDSVNESISSILLGLSVKNVEFSKFRFDDFVKLGYQYISSEEAEKHEYEDFKMQIYGSDSDINDRLCRIAFSYSDMAKWINNHIAENTDTSIYISSVVDVFIDMGLIVPAILHIGDEIILRAYKMGEYSKLTRDQINAFICMLFGYEKKVNRYLGKTELEKLCVLFFKKQLFQATFIQADSYEAGCYGIAYSYYGPRVSTSVKEYEVTKESALVSDFCDSESVEEIDDKYRIKEDKIIEDDDLKEECMQFAFQYGELNEIFSDPRIYWCSYINTMSKYLTMLAIGNNTKDKVLSLCAEIQFIQHIDGMFTSRINDLPKRRLKGYLSGINNGLWKYICYKEDALNKTYEQLKSINLSVAYNTRPKKTVDDRGDAVEEFIDECGRFLFKSAYILNQLLYYTNRSKYFLLDGKDEQCIFNKSYYFYPPMEKLRLEIKNDIDEKIKYGKINEVALMYNKELNNEAGHFIEKCDLYLEKSNARIMDIKKFLLVRSHRGNLPLSYNNINICDLEKVSKSGEIQIISIHHDEDTRKILGTMIENTKTVSDCEYVLIDLSDLPFGYAQVEKDAKGTVVKSIIKEILEDKIGGLSYTFKTLYVYQKNDEKYDGKYDAIGVDIQLIEKFNNVDEKGNKLLVYSIMKEGSNDSGVKKSIIFYGNNNQLNVTENVEGDQVMADKKFNASVGGNGIAISGEGNESKITYTNIEDNGIDRKALLEEFTYVIGKLKESDELDEDEKDGLVSVMTSAQEAVENNSENEIKEVKSRFDLVWGFVKKTAPSIISLLANCAQISTFFGIHL